MSPVRRVRMALTAYVVVLLIGVLGYQVLQDVSFLDALYMTIITVTTVGFREVVEPDGIGKVFTILLIVGGVASATYAAVSMAEFVVEGHFRRIIERRRMERKIADLDQHVIVCGFGRVGRHLAAELLREGVPFVVVDDNDEKIEEVESLDYLFVDGDATEEHVLEEAGLDAASAVVACVNTDADNVLITLTAKGMRPQLTVVARVKADENEAKLLRAGADRVIAPSTIGGKRIAQLLTRPVVADFLELVGAAGGLEYSFEEVPVKEGSELDGSTLREAAIRERFGCTVLGIRHTDQEKVDTHPSAETELQAGDVLIVIGSEEDVAGMRARFR
ncbi:MAG: potassium channel protein [Actinobacteria bacterium]|nr:potassium channel protein [Actinomycetota bacterium]